MQRASRTSLLSQTRSSEHHHISPHWHLSQKILHEFKDMAPAPMTPVIEDCIYTYGPTAGRDVTSTICLDDMEPHAQTVTHSKCQNAFHVSCFNDLPAAGNEDKPAGANSAPLNVVKCPLCRVELVPRAKAGCEPPEGLARDRETT